MASVASAHTAQCRNTPQVQHGPFQVSGTAVKELRQRGYGARALVGGIIAWHAIGGTTVPLDTSTYEEVA